MTVTVSHDTPTSLALSIPSSGSNSARMCRSKQLEISIDTDTEVVIETNNKTIELSRVSAGPSGEDRASFFIDPNNFVAGNTYVYQFIEYSPVRFAPHEIDVLSNVT